MVGTIVAGAVKPAGERKILIVDDDADLLNLLAEGLAFLGAAVLQATDGRAALELVKREKPDVIISDIRMPILDGLEMMTILNEMGRQIPIIFMTGFGDSRTRRRSFSLGSFDFLEKPMDMDRLIHAVQTAFEFGGKYQSQELPYTIKNGLLSSVNLEIDKALCNRAAAICQRENISLTSLVEEALARLIATRNAN